MQSDSLSPGLAVIHANRLENLRDLLVAWIAEHPLAPLENEVVLVQSNGMAQWLKLALAADEGLGICAAIEVQLPARFLWHCYQSVLTAEMVPERSPFDKTDIAWRIFRHLPRLTGDPRFAALQGFLQHDDDSRKRYQLSQCLADLFDQYQVYRADWLQDWEKGFDQLRDSHGKIMTLPEPQRWQPALWRAVVDDVADAQRRFSRAGLHQQFLQALEALNGAPAGMPRRLIIFGISSLPQQTLQALQALGRFSQILLCVHNPCRYYWADIIEHKDLLRSQHRRHPDKLPAAISQEQLHLHANPLLAAWGKQGRDYIGLLNEIDDPQHYRDWFQRIDLFEDCAGEADAACLLQHIQQAILDLTPLPEAELRPAIAGDASLQFHLAHSPQREVEILHDQLLAMFEHSDLEAREVIVMVPDIDRYAPHIRAVFGQVAVDDPRYIPFGVSDQRQRGQNPLLIALEFLLQLPDARFTVSELLDLLDVPALRKRFGIAAADVPTLKQWIQQAGVRWGLNGEQRQSLGMPSGLEQNTWLFGLRRMLLGYAVGSGEAWQDIEPYDEIAGLNAVLLGPLSQLLEALESSWRQLAQPAAAVAWGLRLRELLQRFFVADTDGDELTLDGLHAALDDWDALCERVDLDESLPLSVIRDVWLEAIDQPSLTQRFLAGRVNFCTLMPMRSIPFQVVCLLGMNDGEFPRSSMSLSFDLMSSVKSYRPGDRSRRDDDRYLFLEALLSARGCLYISWIGRSINDNTGKPPSLLVGQLRDYIVGGWQLAGNAEQDRDGGEALLAALTTLHPLQAFSADYFRPDGDAKVFSYAREWRAAWTPIEVAETAGLLPPIGFDTPLTLNWLAAFVRYPVKAFFNQRLQIWLENADVVHDDDESFACDSLQAYALGGELLQAALHVGPQLAEQAFAAVATRQQRLGVLPLAGFAGPSQNGYVLPAWAAWQHAVPMLQRWSTQCEQPLAIELSFNLADGGTLMLEDWLGELRRNDDGDWVQLLFSPQSLHDSKQQPKYHNLIRPWLKHLAGCAMGVKLTTLQIGSDGCIELPPLPQALAQQRLQAIVGAWWHGMRQPLPLACRSAFAWLSAEAEQAHAAAERLYHGDGFMFSGEVDDDAYLARQFPSFSQLHEQQGEDFKFWLETLYRPLWAACNQANATGEAA